MKRIALLCLLLCGCLDGSLGRDVTPEPTPDVQPSGPSIPMQAVFAVNTSEADRISDSRRIAGMLDALASVVETETDLTYANQVLGLRQEAIDVAFHGITINGKYPQFGPTVKPHFEAAMPDGTAELTPELRTKAANVFRSVAAGCREVR